jgi:hypothetical protein
MAKPEGDELTEARLNQAAQHLGSVSLLYMLKALTEGDVRSVKRDEPDRTWFTPQVAYNLEAVSHDVERRIRQLPSQETPQVR